LTGPGLPGGDGFARRRFVDFAAFFGAFFAAFDERADERDERLDFDLGFVVGMDSAETCRET
jgi:hypothetical protein